jgi:hypothetical protein
MGSGITYNKEMFNTEPLLNELNNIIKERLETMLQEFLFKYRLFEENYNAVLNLPAFKHNVGTYKSFNVKKSSSNKKKKSTKKISIIKNLLEKNKLLQEEINKLKGVNIIDLTSDTDSDDNTNVHVVVIKEEPIIVRLEKENIRLNIEEDSIVEDNNDNICCDCECRVILDSDITVVDGKKYCGVCVPEQDDEESDAGSVASLEEEESDKEEEEESDKEEEEESDKESDKSLEEEEEQEEEEETVASLEEEEEQEEEDDVDTEASDEESVDETSNDLANKDEVVPEASVEEDEELFEIEIDDETYCTNNEVNGFIYILDKDGDVGDKIGYFKDSEPIFYNEEN